MIAAVGVAWLYLFEPLDSNFMLPAYLALVCVPIYALTWVQDGIGKAFAWMGLSMVPPYVVRPALLLIAMVAAHTAGMPMEAKTAVAAAIVATWGAGIVQTLLMNRRLQATAGIGNPQYDFPAVAADDVAAARDRCQRVHLAERRRSRRLALHDADRRRHLLRGGQDDVADPVRALCRGQRRRQPLRGAWRTRRQGKPR